VPLFAILTLFPEALEPYLRSSILGIARARGLARFLLMDIRDFARDRHRTVDDRPYGGGPGMVLKPEPIVDCVEWLEGRHGRFRKLVMCPAGRPFRQPLARELAVEERTLLLCGRYEGFDDRLVEMLDLESVSIGDFVLSGGELPALCVIEAAVRLIPGVLGHEESAAADSFGSADSTGSKLGGLDHPHFTRPPVFRGRAVPDVLLSGNHGAIREWRENMAQRRTERQRPDLLEPSETKNKHEGGHRMPPNPQCT